MKTIRTRHDGQRFGNVWRCGLPPGQAGLHVALLEFGFGLDVLRVIVTVLIHHHPVAAEVIALG